MPTMSPAAEKRLITLMRQLDRYLASPRPPWPADSVQARRAHTLRLRVIRANLRRQRALLVQGHERGWQAVALTEADAARAARLAE